MIIHTYMTCTQKIGSERKHKLICFFFWYLSGHTIPLNPYPMNGEWGGGGGGGGGISSEAAAFPWYFHYLVQARLAPVSSD